MTNKFCAFFFFLLLGSCVRHNMMVKSVFLPYKTRPQVIFNGNMYESTEQLFSDIETFIRVDTHMTSMIINFANNSFRWTTFTFQLLMFKVVMMSLYIRDKHSINNNNKFKQYVYRIFHQNLISTFPFKLCSKY